MQENKFGYTQEQIATNANIRYLYFTETMMGFDCFLGGVKVAKSTIFWMQERSINISKKLSKVKVIRKQ
jgi:hypothetical protein